MDQGSSPHLPAGSLLTNKSHGGTEGLFIGKKFEGFDDSSSVTSMSSASKATLCMVCKGEGSVVKRLVQCTRCKWKIHQGCASPYIEDCDAPWTCKHCKNKQENKKKIAAALSTSQSSTKFSTPPYNSPYARSHPAPKSVVLEPAKESPKVLGMKLGIQCEVDSCTTFFFTLPSGSRPLCPKHRIEERHASAKAAPPKPAPAPRSFNKDKLYPVKPDDKPFLKRKRPAAKRSSGGSHQDMCQEQSMFTFQPPARSEFTFKAPEPVRSPPTPTRPSPRSAFKRTPEQNGRQTNKLKSPGEVETAVDDLNRSLSSASMAESPIEPTTGWQRSLFSGLNSAREILQIVAQDSPDYSPPPPEVVDDTNPWTGIDDRDDSPGSQIAQELAATASQQDVSESNSLEFGMAGLPSIEEEIAASHAHPYQPPRVRDPSDDDEEMLDPDSLALIDRLASEHPSSPGKSASPPARRPSSSTYSANVSSDAEEPEKSDPPHPESGSYRELLIDTHDEAPPPISIEVIRAQRAANFDTTELDSFLFKQAQPQSDEQPTSKELLSTQIWGHIDPRVAWPRKMTEEERQEKIKEIEARGGRKANFGKILTAQVRKERADKGWNVHQTSEWRSEEECKEMDRRLEELFGKEGLGNCVPGIRNGRLVMIEQLEPEEPQTGPGRRKRRREPRIYPVIGGQ